MLTMPWSPGRPHYTAGVLLLLFHLHHLLFLLLLLHALVPRTQAQAFAREEQDVYFNKRPTNVSIHVGDTGILQCSINNLGTKTVLWRRAADPHPIAIGDVVFLMEDRYDVQMTPDRGDYNLVIKDVQLSDAGVYECQVSSRQKLIWHVLVHVNATARPEREHYIDFKKDKPDRDDTSPPAIYVTGTVYVEKGDRIHLTCNATGNVGPPEDLDWFKDGMRITPDVHQKIEIQKFQVLASKTIVSNLILKHSQMTDAGTYVCRSSNLDITSIKVHVLNAGSPNVKRGTSSTEENEEKPVPSSLPCLQPCYTWVLLSALVTLFLSSRHWLSQGAVST